MVTTTYAETNHVKPNVNLDNPQYQQDFDECWQVWNNNLEKNQLRRKYYEGKIRVKNIGISIPDDLTDIPVKCGWCAKAVKALAVRSRFDGYTSTGDTTEIDRLVTDNRLKREYRNIVRAQLIYGVAFLTVTAGHEGEPAVVIRGYSAVNAACTWNYEKERIKAGITVHDVDSNGIPTRYYLYEDDAIIEISRLDNYQWQATEYPNQLGRPAIEPLVYDGDDDYPLGHSRLTNTAMEICDRMMRESLRTELASELSAVPSKYILGGTQKDVQEATKNQKKWDLYIDTVNWITKDRDGDVPQVGEFNQPSMQPHLDYMDFLASQFAEETSLPVEMLGVTSKTYTSTNSAVAANEPLVIAAQDMNDDNRETLAVVAHMALATLHRTSYDADNSPRMIASFKDPSMPSITSTADSAVKLAAVIPGFGSTDVGMEMMGFDEDQRMRIRSDIRRGQSTQILNTLDNAVANNQPNTENPRQANTGFGSTRTQPEEQPEEGTVQRQRVNQ